MGSTVIRPVSMHLREKKFSTMLNLILDLLATERGKLGYTIDDGVITISTQDDRRRARL